MIKVPATEEGIPAIQTLIREGIHVNVTLLFARSMYERVARAYIAGLQERAADGGDVSSVRSVASFNTRPMKICCVFHHVLRSNTLDLLALGRRIFAVSDSFVSKRR